MKTLVHKFWYIKRDDDGKITEAAVRVLEGDMYDVEVLQDDNETYKTESHFKADKPLNNSEMGFMGHSRTKESQRGVTHAVYTKADLGDISDTDELILFLNKKVQKDNTRQATPTQSIVGSVASIKSNRNK